jgi:UDP-N-acetylmuramate dehydrogenase
MTLSFDLPKPLNVAVPPAPVALKDSPIYLPGTSCLIKHQVPLANFTSFKVGGPAEWFVAPKNLEELQASLKWAYAQKLPITSLGAGSNLLISDRGLPGLVISTRNLRYTRCDEQTGQLTASAGEPMAAIAWEAAKRGWEGLEWAIGIPGTVGGAVVMNAGAHKRCTAEILVSTQVLSSDGTLEDLTSEDLGYAYRTSNLQGNSRFVVQATFQLQPGADPEKVKAATKEDLAQRHSTQPYDSPSCGSVFRNPHPHYAASLIEQTGLKGYRIGGAQVAYKHANFILNNGGATASDIFQLICYVQQQVAERWSVRLETEVKILGEFQRA